TSRVVEEVFGLVNQWTAPSKVRKIRVISHMDAERSFSFTSFVDNHGDMYVWRTNDKGQVGDGTNTNRSVPTLVSGDIKWKKGCTFHVEERSGTTVRGNISFDGTLYMWGDALLGQLGVGDTTGRSTPTAVLGEGKF